MLVVSAYADDELRLKLLAKSVQDYLITPSAEDIELTAAVARAAYVIGTPRVDHVIVGGAEHASLHDLGILGHS